MQPIISQYAIISFINTEWKPERMKQNQNESAIDFLVFDFVLMDKINALFVEEMWARRRWIVSQEIIHTWKYERFERKQNETNASYFVHIN